MPLISDVYELTGDGVSATYMSWRRVPGPDPEPMFLPANTLHAKVGNQEYDFAANEIGTSDLTAPSAFVLTVTLSRSVDRGATLLSLVLPKTVAVPVAGGAAKIDAVAIVTTVRTFLANVGHEFPAESYTATVLSGEFVESDGEPPAVPAAAARLVRVGGV